METFWQTWHDAAHTTLGLFWMAFWAFGLGYLISSMIQVFMTRQRMKDSMGETGPRSVLLGTFFGFISSSCSFAALSTTRSLFAKGAGLVPSLAFLLASTNLVIELGIIIAVFLSWQFVVGEYVGGVLLILFMWFIVRHTLPKQMTAQARKHARKLSEDVADESGGKENWKARMASREEWRNVASHYVMEWGMVWKDVTIGFTVAGIIAAFVPTSFFQTLFIGSGAGNPNFLEVLAQTIVGPVAAFFTFIGSMGNIPLAAVLFGNGVSFAGVMAFIFSDLVVFPVLRVQTKYYGHRMALYILAVMLVALIGATLALHYGFHALNLLPQVESANMVQDREFFKLNYTLVLNALFLGLSAWFLAWRPRQEGNGGHGSPSLLERVLSWLAKLALVWLAIGMALPLVL